MGLYTMPLYRYTGVRRVCLVMSKFWDVILGMTWVALFVCFVLFSSNWSAFNLEIRSAMWFFLFWGNKKITVFLWNMYFDFLPKTKSVKFGKSFRKSWDCCASRTFLWKFLKWVVSFIPKWKILLRWQLWRCVFSLLCRVTLFVLLNYSVRNLFLPHIKSDQQLDCFQLNIRHNILLE